MLCYQSELVSDSSIAHWRAPWFPCLPSFRFQQRISGQRQTHHKRELDWRVQKIFLERVDSPVFHFVSSGVALVVADQRIVQVVERSP
jgi:hypothetical protein